MTKKIAVIAGAGVAGLTAAHELIEHTDIQPIIFEKTSAIGGIAKTVNYKGNLMDIGGHRFFSKSDRIMTWWDTIIPFEDLGQDYMLERHRVSRIFYMKKFFDYPIRLNGKTLKNLGLKKIMKVAFSYMRAMALPIKPETSLEDFFINRFGRELYETFFKDYTEKVWGVPCDQINPEWGSQRVKGIDIKAILKHAIKTFFSMKEKDIGQKDVETSLIDRFLYPKYGVGQMWDKVAKKVLDHGAEIHLNKEVVEILLEEGQIRKIFVKDSLTGQVEVYACDYFFSTMAIKDLVKGMEKQTPEMVKDIAQALAYRDFISVGLLLKSFDLGNDPKSDQANKIKDNWIYVQENYVKMGRIQIFNNWSPYMVKNQENMWVGLEYFCNEGDDFWQMKDQDLEAFAVEELLKVQAIRPSDVIDATVVRMPKAYPSYIGAYEQFDVIKDYLDSIHNLFLIGRNGMHRYNNMDHSMLTAMEAVDNIKNGVVSKDNIWQVNIEKEYHEEKDAK